LVESDSLEIVAMATAKPLPNDYVPPLVNGDRLDQKTFHVRYEHMPENCRAELIGGIVYMTSPQRVPHSKAHPLIARWLDEYAEATPGTDTYLNNTQILGPESEPQPDACLFVLPEYGGRVYEDDEEYLHGPPELVVEVSAATESIDLHLKKVDYQNAAVPEYVVIALRQRKVFWFHLRSGKYKEVSPSADGVIRSRIFPGLWLNSQALVSRDRSGVLETLRQGLASPEHAAFVTKLAKRAKKK
jgi:Uma2 family endonuclease